MSFASGAAEGACGLTECEMTAVCQFEMQYKFDDYVTKTEKGCLRNDKPVTELCYPENESTPTPVPEASQISLAAGVKTR
mgnify:FL=1|jgi:hypothetical protein|tara:strand:- start:1060 stop:1299 length:240 start_codon:yes stop_codon:yes gene_type:complete